jgi:acyl carrier protein phosphodiesterase
MRDLYDADVARAAVAANQRYCRLAKELWGEEDPRSAQGLDDLARVYTMMGEYRRAMQLLQQASEINKLTVGEEHPSYLHNSNCKCHQC